MASLDRIELAPPVGDNLAGLVRTGKALDHFEIAPEEAHERKPFFHADPIDTTVARFGNAFLDPGFRRYRTSAFSVHKFPDVTLIGTDGVLLHAGAVIPDTLVHIQYWMAGSAVETFQVRRSLRLRRPLSVARRLTGRPCFIGFTASWRNYAHWMQQSLPLLVAFVTMRARVPAIRIVLPRFEEGSFQQQTLRLLEIGPEDVIEIADGEAVTFAECYVMNTPDIWSVSSFSQAAAAQLARVALLERPGLTPGHPRIYLHRDATARAVANFDAVKALVERYDFHVVSFEATRVAEQIAIMRGARHLIAEHGAGLANMLFCEPGCRVLEMFNPICVQPAFWSLASCCNLEFGYLIGDHVPTAFRPERDWNSSYSVPLARLEQAIRIMLAAEAGEKLPIALAAAIVAPGSPDVGADDGARLSPPAAVTAGPPSQDVMRSLTTIASPDRDGTVVSTQPVSSLSAGYPTRPGPAPHDEAAPANRMPDLPRIRFTSPEHFEIGDIKFSLPRGQQATTPDRVLFYKDRGFVDSYCETLPPLAPRRVFEFGIYQGGSALFLTALLDLEKFVCLDISDPVKAFDEILATHPIGKKIRPYYKTSQDAADGIREILEREFGDSPPDMIIDDASHQYELTKKSFEIAFPYLRDGGHYVIEDWAWAHWPENQTPAHGWSKLPAMSNLILELAILLPSSDLIESITIRHGYVIIKKMKSRFQHPRINITGTLRMRGHELNKI